MFSLFITINVKPGQVDEFLRACSANAQGALRDEPGCFGFKINQDAEIPTRFHVYEVFRDEAAFDAHRETPHFLKWKDSAKSFVDGEITRLTMNTVFPSDDGLEKQKPGLLNW